MYCEDMDYVEEVIDDLIVGGSDQLQVLLLCYFYYGFCLTLFIVQLRIAIIYEKKIKIFR